MSHELPLTSMSGDDEESLHLSSLEIWNPTTSSCSESANIMISNLPAILQ